ncbi:MDR family MFS transporter [Kitasatospora sp. NPDC098652]|uniref:MDR family MFS transporter n=1 Tax=Kitasatospora sp. NPDC098652 TaxID=3364095 RepID=UPI00380B6A07
MAQSSSDAQPAGKSQPLPPELLRVAGVVLIGLLVMQLDGTMVSVALNTLAHDLSASVATLQWVVTAYLLALMVGMPLAGWAADRFGPRTMWIVSLAVFLVGSVLCGLSTSIWMLVAARVLQGLGGGMMVPVGQAMLMRLAGMEHRAKLVALMAIPGMIGPTLGPVLGGVIVDGIDWRWMFFINIPIGVIAFLVAGRNLPNMKAETAAKLDVLGVLLLVPGLVAIVYGFSRAGAVGFGSGQVIALLAVGGALLAGFGVHAARPNVDALVSMQMFKYRGFATSCTLLLLVGLTMGAGIVQPLFLQQVHGESPMSTGVLLVAFGVGSVVTSVLLGRVFNKLGPRLVGVVGIVLAIAGAAIYPMFDAGTSRVLIITAMLVSGVGLAMVVLTMSTALYVGLPPQQIARATGASRIFQQLGLSAGTAVISVVLQIQLSDQTDRAPDGTVGPTGLAHAYSTTFWWGVGFLVLAVVPTLFLPKTVVAPAPVPRQAAEAAQSQGAQPQEA